MSSKDYDKYSSSSSILFYASIAYLINGIIYVIIFTYNRCYNNKVIIQRDNVEEAKQKQPTVIKRVGVSKTFKSEGAKNIPITITVPSLASSSVISVDPMIESNRAQQEQNVTAPPTIAPKPLSGSKATTNKTSDIATKKTIDVKPNKDIQLLKSAKNARQNSSPASETSKDKQPLKAKTVKKRI